MNTQRWRGIFAIPMTPYAEDDRIDVSVLEKELEFIIGAGAKGICSPVMVSEFELLSEEERRLMIKIPVEVSNGRIPIISGVSAVNIPLAVSYAQYSEKVGADMIIAMPPYARKGDFGTIYKYYQNLSDAVDLPIMIQNEQMSSVLSTDQLIQLCTEIENVKWVKEEIPPSPSSIANLLDRQCSAVEGVMAGNAGQFMLTEWQRGAVGVILACQYCDVMQKVWNLLDSGEKAAARDLFYAIQPAIVLETLMGFAFSKEIMIRRGIFNNHVVRYKTNPLSKYDLTEIDACWSRIEKLLVWPKT
jgi:dihydrodipicolinate synthase/N-acetylneuraminate lyase